MLVLTSSTALSALTEGLAVTLLVPLLARITPGGAAVLPRLGLTLTLGEMLALFVALAMRRPALLILDEATSALDPQNEQLIARALSGLRSRMTILLIAHRGVLSDLADQTFQLDQGRLRAAA